MLHKEVLRGEEAGGLQQLCSAYLGAGSGSCDGVRLSRQIGLPLPRGSASVSSSAPMLTGKRDFLIARLNLRHSLMTGAEVRVRAGEHMLHKEIIREEEAGGLQQVCTAHLGAGLGSCDGFRLSRQIGLPLPRSSASVALYRRWDFPLSEASSPSMK